METNPFKEMVFIDFETTGLNPKTDKILEMGALRVKYLDEVGALSLFVHHNLDEHPHILKKFKRWEFKIRNGMEEKQALETLLNFIGDSLIVAHNIPHDLGFLTHAVIRHGMKPIKNSFFDTLSISKYRTVYPHKLQGMCSKYKVKYETGHDAFLDCVNCYSLFDELNDESVNYEEELEDKLEDEFGSAHEIEVVDQMAYFINRICYFEKYEPPSFIPDNAIIEPIKRLTSSDKLEKRFVKST